MNKLLFIILYLTLSSCTGAYYIIEDDRPTVIYQRTSLDNYCNMCNTHYTYNHNHNLLFWHYDIKPNKPNKPRKPNRPKKNKK